ncbi:hypothetical protein K488DRAFT_86383 [Vararia minispora EC-137]|uniref:Uncharacterized protein n=1 Tax=Vararia minispora EC-137 TaxID=1314806 RepID=A0ACB8QJR5_9AGAM|nr:hypothetical protein K488DRAFT_86383 [Vararia minispora EC-137]
MSVQVSLPDLAVAPSAGGLSLLSLSLAAASAAPIELPAHHASSELPGDDVAGSPGSYHKRQPPHGLSKPRRLSSASQSRRRQSEARDAASRPSPTALQSAAAAMTDLTISASPHAPSSTSLPDGDVELDVGSPDEGGGKNKKRGTLFTCESCSKVYRHPSCLIKHRWEHTPHWREASKLMLSKHQQVQLMEAAAILSHLSPSATGGSSLPDDRSLWPSFLSGGALPGAQPIPAPRSSAFAHHPKASSVPLKLTRASSSGPRLHDYAVPASAAPTRLRPGVLAVPTPREVSRVMSPYADAELVAVPIAGGTHRYPPRYGSAGDEPWSLSLGTGTGSSFASVGTPSSAGMGDDAFVDVEAEFMHGIRHCAVLRHYGSGEDDVSVKEEEAADAEWDGMDMEMEM